MRRRTERTYARGDGGALHLVHEVAHGREVGDVRAVGVQSALAARARGQRVDVDLADATGVDLEVQPASHRVLPQLRAGEYE